MHSEIPESDMALKDVAIEFAVSNVSPLSVREDFRDFCKTVSAHGFVLRMLEHMTDMVVKDCPKCKTKASVRSYKNSKHQNKFKYSFSCVCGQEFS